MTPCTLEHRAESLRALAALLRLGYPARSALAAWSRYAPESARPVLAPLGRSIALGLPTSAALKRIGNAFEQDREALSSILEISAALGGDSAAMVEGLAASVETRRESLSSARSASSGAKLSGRLIAGLPLAFVPLFPVSRDHLFTGSNRLSFMAGVALLVAGLLWIARLVPKPPSSDEPGAALAEALAAVLRGGVGPTHALDAIARTPPPGLQTEIRRAERLARLGLGWPEALARSSDPALAAVGSTLERSNKLGQPAAKSLTAYAALRREERNREFETRNRRATVFMLIPLTVCVLPAFILLAIAPFLRGLSLL